MIKVDEGNFSANGNFGQLMTELSVAIIGIFESTNKTSNIIAAAAVGSSFKSSASYIKEKHGIDIIELIKEECK